MFGMIFSFGVTAVLFILDTIFYVVGFLIVLGDTRLGIPVWTGIVLLLLSIIGDFWLFWAVDKLYRQTLRRLDTDFNGFIEEQNRFFKRATGKQKFIIGLNIVNGYIAYRNFGEAERLLMSLNQKYYSNMHSQGKMKSITCRMMLYLHSRNYAAFDSSLADMRAMLDSGGIFANPKVRKHYETLIDISIIEMSFYTRTPEQLVTTDKEITLRFKEIVECYWEENKSVMQDDYGRSSFYYTFGTIYAVLGDRERAENYLKEVAAQYLTYPFVNKSRQYLQSGDTNILMNA